MTGPEIVSLSRKHTLYEWSAPIQSRSHSRRQRQGNLFLHAEGKRFIDFNSQLMSVTSDTATRASFRPSAIKPPLSPMPILSWQPSARRLGAKLAEICPGDIDTFFFTTAEPKPTRTPSSSLASLPDATRSSRAIARIMARLQSDEPNRRSPQMGRRAWHSRRGARAYPITASSADGNRLRVRSP